MTNANHLLDLDPKLVFDLAARVDPPQVVADRYGLDPQYLAEVMAIPHVRRLVAAKRRELDDAGFVLSAKAKLMFEDLLPDVYRKAKSENATLSGVLEAAKFMRTVAGLDRQDPGNTSEKFSITIQFGGQSAPPTTIDVTATTSPGLTNVPSYVPRVVNTDLEYSDAPS